MIMNKQVRIRLLWIPLLVMAMIFLFSSQTAAQQSIRKPLAELLGNGSVSSHLSRMTIHYGTLTVDGKTEGPSAVAEFLLRKLAHLMEYGLLGCCLLWAVLKLTDAALPSAASKALLVCAGYAALDEYHQIFVKGRGPHPQDVLLDTAGAFAGMALYAVWRKWRQSRMTPGLPALRRLP